MSKGRLAPKSRPSAWRYRRHKPGWRRVDPRTRPPKGMVGFWAQARHLLWSWGLWVAISGLIVAEGPRLLLLLTIPLALITHLAKPAAEPPKYGLDHEFSVDSPEFLDTIAGSSGVPFLGGNTVELLNNGDAFYPRMLEAIDRAESTITVEAYIYWAGEVGLQFARGLAKRARAGVRVTILLDAVGSSNIGPDILRELERGGCQVAWYNPISWHTLGRFNNRTHRKSLIIDGEVAFTGGAGIADHWRGDARGPDEWRDVQVRIAGPAVTPLQSGFAHNWKKTTSELITGAAYYPDIEPRGPLAVQTMLSSPETGGSSVSTMYYLSIVCARRFIYIANPYFIPDPVAIETLIEARQRGVDVRVMVSGLRNDNWVARQNSIRLYGRLLAAGIDILEYNRTMMHHKTMVVDGVWSTVGTANFDNRSFSHNEESNLCVADRGVASQLERTFLDDAAVCDRVTLGQWNRRGGWARLQELAAALLEEQA
ncbi:MAG: phospholipase D-like domain-containing protein [Vicinamibacterales bacterium]